MARYDSLPRTRIGAVPFLNAIPLIYGLEYRVQFFSPAVLAEEFDAGRVDVALLPIVEYFTHDDRVLLPKMAIGSNGPVQSVKLFLNKPLEELRYVGVDRRSRTSALLTRVILETRYNKFPQYAAFDPGKDFFPQRYDGFLLIGDDALRFDKVSRALDLGEEWTKWTGLPFVFACWQVRRGFSDQAVVDDLEHAAAMGLSRIDQIASLAAGFDHAFVRRYLSQSLCYELGQDQEHAIELFVRFLTQLKVPLQEKKIVYHDRRGLGKGLIQITP